MVATEMPIVSPLSAPTNASANLVSVETEDNAKVVQWVLYCLSPVIDRNQQIWVWFINPFHYNDWQHGENYGKCTDWNLNFIVINCLNNTTLRLCYSIVVRNVFLVFNSHFSFFLLQQNTIPVLLTTVDVITFVRTKLGEPLAVVTKDLNSIQIRETVWVSKQKGLLIYCFPVALNLFSKPGLTL